MIYKEGKNIGKHSYERNTGYIHAFQGVNCIPCREAPNGVFIDSVDNEHSVCIHAKTTLI